MPATTVSTTTTTTAAVVRETVEIGTDAQALVDRFVEVRDLINALDKEKKALNEAILAALGEAEAGTVAGRVRVEASKRHRETVDAKVLAEAFPEAYEATRRVTDYTVLVVK